MLAVFLITCFFPAFPAPILISYIYGVVCTSQHDEYKAQHIATTGS